MVVDITDVPIAGISKVMVADINDVVVTFISIVVGVADRSDVAVVDKFNAT